MLVGSAATKSNEASFWIIIISQFWKAACLTQNINFMDLKKIEQNFGGSLGQTLLGGETYQALGTCPSSAHFFFEKIKEGQLILSVHFSYYYRKKKKVSV